MAPQLSKFIDASCKEFSHPWVDSCTRATTGLGLNTLQESLRIYSTVYIVAFLMRGKVPSKGDVKKTVLGILQSTAFLSWNGFAYSFFVCFLRRVLGHFNILTVSFFPAFLASFTAILIERPSRRTLLSLYVSNIASETLFRMGVSRGYWHPVPFAETCIFAISMAALLYYYRSKTSKSDPVYKILRLVVGKYEDAEYLENPSCEIQDSSETVNRCRNDSVVNSPARKDINIFMKSLEAYGNLLARLKVKSKRSCCPHPFSCIHYILKGGVQVFGYAFGGQLVVNLVFGVAKLIKKPTLLKSMIVKKGNLYLPIFIGGFAALYRLLWYDLAEKGIVPEVKWFAIFLYCFNTAVVFHAAIVEPQNLRSSYWKFLHNVSGGRIAAMSRTPIDKFGLNTSKHLADVLKATNTTDKMIFHF
ncbi:transmembrane protein 135-like isoform X2 [Ceratina calcarata]|uniref:Transmembrane protein 135-like isoform X2 n=1 Tax=Ceratina calcarata TaxID=156304 RepID=A0AAJ7S1R9_9HYME|nr:transmembrane protein 135-like isoform X2 [Ceratina calcarata]